MTPANRTRVHLAASDPANPYGSLLPWLPGSSEPEEPAKPHSMARASGASVILVNGRLAAFFRRRNPAFRVFLPEDEPERTQVARELAQKLAEVAIARQSRRHGVLIGEINEQPAREHFLGRSAGGCGLCGHGRGIPDAARDHRRFPHVPSAG